MSTRKTSKSNANTVKMVKAVKAVKAVKTCEKGDKANGSVSLQVLALRPCKIVTTERLGTLAVYNNCIPSGYAIPGNQNARGTIKTINATYVMWTPEPSAPCCKAVRKARAK